jgi:hypothetical protein
MKGVIEEDFYQRVEGHVPERYTALLGDSEHG